MVAGPVGAVVGGVVGAVGDTVAELRRPRDFAPAVIPSVRPQLNCPPTITVGETFHLIQNAGQELGAIDSELAK